MINICIVIVNRANYGRVKFLMKSLSASSEVNLQIILTSASMLDRFGSAFKVIEDDGFKISKKFFTTIEGENLITQAKTAGLGTIELSSAFDELKPDIVVTVADRFETISAAISAAYMNIPLAHIQGGDVSGNIDDKVRNAITYLSDYHFPSSENSFHRLISMGINKEKIFNFGCPSIDILLHEDLEENFKDIPPGLGPEIDWGKPYILCAQHPVTTSYGFSQFQITETLNALIEFPSFTKIILWPNPDAGSDDLSKGIRIFREKTNNQSFVYYKNFPPNIYASIISKASCLVGNSSSFIREGAYLGVPAVLIGDRQKNREVGSNVVFSGYDRHEIKKLIVQQLSKKKFPCDTRFGDGNAGENICKKLIEIASKK